MRRRLRTLLVLSATVALLVGAGTVNGATLWNHDPASAIGPAHWGDLDPSFAACETGRSQSPVNIVHTVRGGGPALRFRYADNELVVENTGHVIEVPMPAGGHQTLGIGGKTYTLTQFHFHAPSEHTLNGRHFDLEAHLVHQSADGQLAVVGVLMDIDDHPNALVDEVFEHAPDVAGEETEVGIEANAREAPAGLPAGTWQRHVRDQPLLQLLGLVDHARVLRAGQLVRREGSGQRRGGCRRDDARPDLEVPGICRISGQQPAGAAPERSASHQSRLTNPARTGRIRSNFRAVPSRAAAPGPPVSTDTGGLLSRRLARFRR